MPLPSPLPARVAVLGFARSGRALAEALVARGVEVAVAEGVQTVRVEIS